jgi:hypothetical protein
MRLTEHVARIGERRNAYRILVEKPEGKKPLGRPRRRWEDISKISILLKWILGRQDGAVGLELSGSGYGPVNGSCEDGNKTYGSIKCWEILEELSDWRLSKKGSAPWS